MARVYPRAVEEGRVYPTNTYGDIRVNRYHSSTKVEIEFLETGFKKNTTAGEIKKGEVRDNSLPYRTTKVPKQSVFEGEIYTSTEGPLRVIKYYSALEVQIEFIQTGYVRMVAAGEIRKGSGMKDHYKPSVFGIGFLGVGDFKANSRRIKSAAYNTWHNMIQRCYSERYQLKYPYWKDCSVVPAWHNFQVFARWYYDNYVEGYDLDKDKRVLGNRIYGPDFCHFIPMSENRLTRGKPTGQYKARHI